MCAPVIAWVTCASPSITAPGRIPESRHSAAKPPIAAIDQRSTSRAFSAAGVRARPRKLAPNARTKQAAARNQVRFVDVFLPKGHDACAAPAKRWAEGATPASPAAMYHPNAAGMKAEAKMIVASLRAKTSTR